MKRFTFPVLTLALTLALTACVDTTGLTGDIHKDPHPKSNPNGAVIVSEFADLQCPACRAAHETVTLPLLAQYGSVVRFEFHHFPLRSIHRYALAAAEAAECSGDQGKFWEFVDQVYAQQDKLSTAQLAAWAEDLKLDIPLFTRCTKSHIKREAILAEYTAAEQGGVRGTPTFFVNGKQTPATVDDLGKAIEAIVKGQQKML
ncbi:thioredoxin domain-containing protein [Candidatus Peregrinibacteria bacterium]|nr:thioredoxin domain-containing protein [Candidatus Peregrinibacteria bacterium]